MIAMEIRKIAREIKAEQILTLWHGGNLESNEEMIAHKSGRWEYGPGLYLTTHYDTARKYSKGSRKLYKIVVRKGTNIRDVMLPMNHSKGSTAIYNNVYSFIHAFVPKKKQQEIIDRIKPHIKNETISADTFLNIMVNEKAIKNTDTDSLREFLVQHGVDYSIVSNAFGWHETMIVLFNMKLIVSKTIVKPKDKIDTFDLPTEFKEDEV
jgi:hypothetical protein